MASAVNLAFSIELYLKALRAIHNKPTRRGHYLAELYTELPKELRQDLS